MEAPLKLKPNLLLTFLFFLILYGFTYARFIIDQPDLVSDSVEASKVLQFLRLVVAEETCEQSYGFLPCTTSALGKLFLILVYGYLMFLAAMYLSTDSELLLEILGPGLVGGLFFPCSEHFQMQCLFSVIFF
ncbi:sodium/calcium exchanger family protein / calcium-binding EF hand family protein [Perilla frutescens var. hirtella]|uniref:Sodium/calcium exchanger family protein / calcium-binding EF hand family protein n=1 Tax=Perilla frutescens var. hirtella TaxID=608512 RepID=A0AAD4P4L6_PERFH|nr:sodium/calcium exchanger family protein / calcium-binding EF hand family protein [Perilla frutescens var. hirtella]